MPPSDSQTDYADEKILYDAKGEVITGVHDPSETNLGLGNIIKGAAEAPLTLFERKAALINASVPKILAAHACRLMLFPQSVENSIAWEWADVSPRDRPGSA